MLPQDSGAMTATSAGNPFQWEASWLPDALLNDCIECIDMKFKNVYIYITIHVVT